MNNSPDNLFDHMKAQMLPDNELLQKTKEAAAARYKPKRYLPLYRAAAMAACFALVAASLIFLPGLLKQTPAVLSSGSSVSSAASVPFRSTVQYDELSFPKSSKVKIPDGYTSAAASMDISSFKESFLKNAVMVIRCTVVDAYCREYRYDTYSDKFEENGRLHNREHTIVYELKVDELLYSETSVKAGDRIKIEEGISSEDAAYDLAINRQYILPIDKVGDTILLNPEEWGYAGGNITRDSPYAIDYPYAPPIEVTLSGQYVFHNQWVSLINGKTADVVTEDNDPFYKLKMRSDEQFLDDLKALIKKYKG